MCVCACRILIGHYLYYQHIQGGSKSKLFILSEHVNKTEEIGGMCTNTNIYRKGEHYLIFSCETFYVTTVLCLNII